MNDTVAEHKSEVRERVWSELRKVAVPDSRFHFDFGEFIADFEGGETAVERLLKAPDGKPVRTGKARPGSAEEVGADA